MSTLGFESAIVAQKLVGNIPKKEMLLRFWRQIFFFFFWQFHIEWFLRQLFKTVQEVMESFPIMLNGKFINVNVIQV